jgi:hypothetical protein
MPNSRKWMKTRAKSCMNLMSFPQKRESMNTMAVNFSAKVIMDPRLSGGDEWGRGKRTF